MANAFDHVCPKCGDADHIDVAATIWLRLTEDGTDSEGAENGDHEFTPDSLAVCQACEFTGKLGEFDVPEAGAARD